VPRQEGKGLRSGSLLRFPSWTWTSWEPWRSEGRGAGGRQRSAAEKEVEGEMRWQRKDRSHCPKPFIGHGCGPTIHFTPALTPRSFPMHGSRGNYPTTPSIFASHENRGAVGEH
jgi:hypothetical protein